METYTTLLQEIQNRKNHTVSFEVSKLLDDNSTHTIDMYSFIVSNRINFLTDREKYHAITNMVQNKSKTVPPKELIMKLYTSLKNPRYRKEIKCILNHEFV